MATPRSRNASSVCFFSAERDGIAPIGSAHWTWEQVKLLPQARISPRVSLARGKLQCVEPRIFAAPGEQLLVRAQLGDAAARQHGDARRVPDGRQPVGDDE